MRNIILVAGPFADGKTRLITSLREALTERGIAVNPRVITDAKYMQESVEWDDQRYQGIHHMHTEVGWPVPHLHFAETPFDFSGFVSAGYEIQQSMFGKFFAELSRASEEGYVFAELAGGKNINSPEHPASRNDYSFGRMVEELRSGNYATGWIERIALVLHPSVADFAHRVELNNWRKTHEPTENEIKNGTASWSLPDIVMNNTGVDDFEALAEFLVSRGVAAGRVETIHNGADEAFFTHGMEALIRHGIILEGPSRKESR